MVLFLILILPLTGAASMFLSSDIRRLGQANIVLHAVILGAASFAAFSLSRGTPLTYFDFFYADALSGYYLFVIAVVNFFSAMYSSDYLARDLAAGILSVAKARMYYVLFNLFAFTMFLVTVLNNLGFVWVAIEMTTLVSAFLVGFYNDHKSVEAAWKYLIICSVGIALAFLGTILFYYTGSVHAGVKSLNWTDMLAAAGSLDTRTVKIAFMFILVGYGTKAGLAPMHTWLPDAHSQAPAPISALLSGVLLKTSLYAIMRFMVIANHVLGAAFTGKLLILFGIASLVLSAGFILVQKDIKRLFAYSSIEHVGIIAFGLGIGGPLAIFGALFHVFNHALTKTLMFFGAGEIVKKYGTHDMGQIRGASRLLPVVGTLTLLGAFALAGAPPFAIFFSEFAILKGAFVSGRYLAGAAFLGLVAAIFAGIISHVSRITLGKAPEDVPVRHPALATKTAFILLFAGAALFGIAMPAPFAALLHAAAGILQ